VTAHAVKLAQWQDADSLLGYYVVWDGERLYQMAAGSPKCKAEVRRSFPNVVFHPVTLSQRGKWIEPDEEFVRLMFGYPEFYDVLVRQYSISPAHFGKDDPRAALVEKVKALAESMA
jgi:hypothetical protein